MLFYDLEREWLGYPRFLTAKNLPFNCIQTAKLQCNITSLQFPLPLIYRGEEAVLLIEQHAINATGCLRINIRVYISIVYKLHAHLRHMII